jgi:replicative DNA helicase
MSDGNKLIASIIQTGSVETLRKVKAELFEDDELTSYNYLVRHYRRYAALPSLETLQEETGVRMPRINDTLAFYLQRVYDRALFVATRERFTQLRDALAAFDVPTSRQVIAEMHAACRAITPDEDLRTLSEAGFQVLDRYEDAHHRPGVTGIPTGWGRFDEMTGGYQPSDLVTYVARLGVGKTYTLLSQANYAWATGYSVLAVSMEMSIEQIARRAIGMQAGINPDYIRKGTLCNYSQRRLGRYIENMAGADRFHIYSGAFSKSVADIEILMHELAPDIVFVDGAYILQPENVPGKRVSGRLEGVASVYDSLKRYTLTGNRPIVNSTQFSRQAGKRGKDGGMENIGYTDAIGTHSSIVVGIKEGRPPYQDSRRILELMKGREGERGEFDINYNFAPMDFSEIPLEQQEAEGTDLDWMGEE